MSSSGSSSEGMWKKVWKSCTPPKVRHFVWRALHNTLPVGEALMRRGMECDPTCERCGEGKEDVGHLLLTCPMSKRIWYASPLRLKIEDDYRGSFKGWVDCLLGQIKDQEWWEAFWALCWSIWLGRNEWIFDKRRRDDLWRIDKAVGLVMEYQRAMEAEKIQPGSMKNGPRKWNAPPRGSLKLNTDVAMGKDGKVGLGAMLRDCEGDVLAALCEPWQGACEVDTGEALAVKQGIKVAMEAGFRQFEVETDSLRICQALRKRKKELSPLGVVMQDIGT